MRDLGIPKEVIENLYDTLEDKLAVAATKGFRSSGADEDALTGEFGSAIRSSGKMMVSENGEEVLWSWEIDYTKIRGRGQNAPEKYLGADGIITASVNIGGNLTEKSALFQSKKQWSGSDPKLLNQCNNLRAWEHSSFVLNYDYGKFSTFKLLDVISAKGVYSDDLKRIDIVQFIIDDFLGCRVGDFDLHYNIDKGFLYWMDADENMLATHMPISGVTNISFNRLTGTNDLSSYASPVHPKDDTLQNARIVEISKAATFPMKIRQDAEKIRNWGNPSSITMERNKKKQWKYAQEENCIEFYNTDNYGEINREGKLIHLKCGLK